MTLPPKKCSVSSAWGSATTDGRLIGMDTLDSGEALFGVIVVAFPDHGNNYICGTQAGEIGDHFLMNNKGLFVGVEYHKRFDDRSLLARKRYASGHFGEFRIGQSTLVEPWYYRHSNFQNWCTVKNSDAFSYIGCHYVDLVHFITGLMPVEVSVYGIAEKWPNGNDGFLWTDGRVIWSNGACLNVVNGFGYPNDGPGGNMQGLIMFCRAN